MSVTRADSRRSLLLLLPVAVPAPYPGHAASRGVTPSSMTATPLRVTPVPKEDGYSSSANMYSSGYASETSSEHESLSELPIDRVEWNDERRSSSQRMERSSQQLQEERRAGSPFGSETLSIVSSSRYSRASLLSDLDWSRSSSQRLESSSQRPESRPGRRRQSVPAVVNRSYFTEDVMRVLERDGHVRYQTDVDTGLRSSQFDLRSTGNNVVEQSRRFSEANAAHELARYKSRTQRRRTLIADTIAARTPLVGGITSLTLSRGELRPTMSRVNVFKQMDAQNRPAVPVAAPRSPNSIKDALLRWVQSRVSEYPVAVTNFSSSWSDGMAFCALTHRFAPQAFNFASLRPENRKENFDLAFRVAEEYGIPALLETEDMIMMGDRPDWKCVFTYVQQFYKKFREAP